MTRDDIIRMAKECGNWSGQAVEMNDVGLERFAKLVAAAEREACAKLCDEVGEDLYEALMRECRSNENVANNARAAAEVCSTELRNGRYAEVDQS